MIKSGPIPAGSPGVIAILIGVLISCSVVMHRQLQRMLHRAFREASFPSLLRIFY